MALDHEDRPCSASASRTAPEFVADRAYAGNRRASLGLRATSEPTGAGFRRNHPVLRLSTRKSGCFAAGEKPVETVECPRKQWMIRRKHPSRETWRAGGGRDRFPAPLRAPRGVLKRVGEQSGGLIPVVLGSVLGLGDDAVDHAELQAVCGIGLEGGRGLARLAGVPPQDGAQPSARSPSRSRSPPASARDRRARLRSRRPSRPRRSRTPRSAPAGAPSAPATGRSRRPGRAARGQRPGRRRGCRRD